MSNFLSSSSSAISQTEAVVIAKDAFHILLNDAYEELTEKKTLEKFEGSSYSLIGFGFCALIEWFVNDAMSSVSLQNIDWFCPATILYGASLLFGIIIFLITFFYEKKSRRNNKKAFICKYMKHEKLDILSTPYEVSISNSNTILNG